MRRIVLFGVSVASLLLLTYAGVLLAFSVPITSEMFTENPSVPQGARALIVPLDPRDAIHTAADGGEASLIMRGEASGTFPSSATDVRLGRALLYIPEGANGTVDVEGHTIDLAGFSGGSTGWVVMGAGASDPWFSATEDTLGRVDHFESPTKIGALFLGGALGFVAPLVVIILTHRGAGRRLQPQAAPFCRECRAPLAPGTEFCTRCGAWSKGETPNA